MKRFTDIIEILEDLNDLKRKVYLESPEVFVDFADKIENSELDEMVLFFATKYNYLSIVKFIVENKLVDLNKPSKNTKFATIKDHILAAASQFNAVYISEYLLNLNVKKDNTAENNTNENIETFIKDTISGLCPNLNLDIFEEMFDTQKNTTSKANETKVEENNIVENEEPEKLESENEKIEEPSNISTYEPKFICPNCNCNILESGYSTSEKVTYKYSKEEHGVKVVSKEQLNTVTCANCNYTIEQLTPEFLENLCTVQNCKNCKKDLTSTGITTQMKTEYDSESNSFVTSKKSYHCSECNQELTDYQINYFKL